MNKFLSIAALILWASTSWAQTVVGDWMGDLNVGNTKLPIIFHITKSGDAYATKWDSPNQNAIGLATNKTAFTNNDLLVDASAYGVTYKGKFVADSDKINGFFIQSGLNIPLNFVHSKLATVAARPQDPTSFPYKQEKVTFTNAKAGNTLAATITFSASGKASKIVVLITGSGAQNRDEELMNHRPFLVWSDWLTRHGIAVLRYDDRGVAQSTGIYAGTTTADFADDAEAAVNYIKSRPELKSMSIGLMGHSEGGIIAPMVASRNTSVKFIVLLAAPGVPSDELMIKQNKDIGRLSGVPDIQLQQAALLNQALYKAVKQYNHLPQTTFLNKVDSATLAKFRTLNLAGISDADGLKMVREWTNQVTEPWYRYFLTIEPATYLTNVRCPTLALNGTLDVQVNSQANLAAIKASLEKAGNKKFEIVAMPGLNHLFQKAATGGIPEYGQINETVNLAALQKVSDWINKL